MVAWNKYLSEQGSTFAGAKVGQLDALARDENIFRFDITMENSFPVDIFDGFEKLIHVCFDLVLVKVLVPDQALVQVLVHQLED